MVERWVTGLRDGQTRGGRRCFPDEPGRRMGRGASVCDGLLERGSNDVSPGRCAERTTLGPRAGGGLLLAVRGAAAPASADAVLARQGGPTGAGTRRQGAFTVGL